MVDTIGNGRCFALTLVEFHHQLIFYAVHLTNVLVDAVENTIVEFVAMMGRTSTRWLTLAASISPFVTCEGNIGDIWWRFQQRPLAVRRMIQWLVVPELQWLQGKVGRTARRRYDLTSTTAGRSRCCA